MQNKSEMMLLCSHWLSLSEMPRKESKSFSFYEGEAEILHCTQANYECKKLNL